MNEDRKCTWVDNSSSSIVIPNRNFKNITFYKLKALKTITKSCLIAIRVTVHDRISFICIRNRPGLTRESKKNVKKKKKTKFKKRNIFLFFTLYERKLPIKFTNLSRTAARAPILIYETCAPCNDPRHKITPVVIIKVVRPWLSVRKHTILPGVNLKTTVLPHTRETTVKKIVRWNVSIGDMRIFKLSFLAIIEWKKYLF